MIPVLVALADRRQRIRDYGKHATGTPARHILDGWTVDARTPVPGTHTSTRAQRIDAVTSPGLCTSSALVDPPRPAAGYCPDCVEGCGIRADGSDCTTCDGTGTPKPIGFHAIVLRVLPHADAPATANDSGRRSAHHYGGTP